MKIRVVVACALVTAVASGRDAHAAGVALDIQSARGTGMAGAMTAMVDDSSAIFYNPAGIAQGKIVDVQAGGSLVMPLFTYTSPQGGSTSTNFGVVTPFHVYESGGITDDLSVGVGLFTPFGFSLDWPSDWAGRRLITSSSLETFDINPTVAYRFGRVRVGAGLQLMRATVDLQRDIATGAGDVPTELGAATWGVGGNVGVQVDAVPRYLSLGLHYRSEVKLNFDGWAHFSNVPLAFQSVLHDQPVSTSITTPDIVQIGAASRPIDDLTVALDVVWYRWSTFRSIDLTFPQDATHQLGSSEAKNWNDTVNVHLGAEVALGDSWRVRGGVLYDPSPSPAETLAPDVPDSDRLNLAVGGSYVHPSGFHVDLGYQFLFVLKRTSTLQTFPGDYGGNVNVIGVTIGYRTPRAADPG